VFAPYDRPENGRRRLRYDVSFRQILSGKIFASEMTYIRDFEPFSGPIPFRQSTPIVVDQNSNLILFDSTHFIYFVLLSGNKSDITGFASDTPKECRHPRLGTPDLHCIRWGVKIYSLTHTLIHSPEMLLLCAQNVAPSGETSWNWTTIFVLTIRQWKSYLPAGRRSRKMPRERRRPRFAFPA